MHAPLHTCRALWLLNREAMAPTHPAGARPQGQHAFAMHACAIRFSICTTSAFAVTRADVAAQIAELLRVSVRDVKVHQVFRPLTHTHTHTHTPFRRWQRRQSSSPQEQHPVSSALSAGIAPPAAPPRAQYSHPLSPARRCGSMRCAAGSTRVSVQVRVRVRSLGCRSRQSAKVSTGNETKWRYRCGASALSHKAHGRWHWAA
jgi:hypothetical protein